MDFPLLHQNLQEIEEGAEDWTTWTWALSSSPYWYAMVMEHMKC
jgi:hypothetical protein